MGKMLNLWKKVPGLANAHSFSCDNQVSCSLIRLTSRQKKNTHTNTCIYAQTVNRAQQRVTNCLLSKLSRCARARQPINWGLRSEVQSPKKSAPSMLHCTQRLRVGKKEISAAGAGARRHASFSWHLIYNEVQHSMKSVKLSP